MVKETGPLDGAFNLWSISDSYESACGSRTVGTFLGHMLLTVLGIFWVCVMIDWLRLKLFHLLAPWANMIWEYFVGKIRLLGQ